MTIQVKVSHGESGHPASFYVSRRASNGTLEAPIAVKEGDALSLFIHAGVDLLITERPPGNP